MEQDRFLFAKYLQELKKRVAMDKAGQALGRPVAACRSAQALDAPVRPEFSPKLAHQDAIKLIERGNQQIHNSELEKAKARAAGMAAV